MSLNANYTAVKQSQAQAKKLLACLSFSPLFVFSSMSHLLGVPTSFVTNLLRTLYYYKHSFKAPQKSAISPHDLRFPYLEF